jgi:hypothetical protein
MKPTRASSGERRLAEQGAQDRSLSNTFDERQLAARWDLSVRTLQQWRRNGIGPTYMKLGSRVCYRLCDVVEFERKSLRQGTGVPVYQQNTSDPD